MIKSLFFRLLDWASLKLDLAACKALDKSRMQDIPSASPQGPEDGPRWRVESMGYESGPGWDAFVVSLTPDRPIDPYMEQVRQEASALTGKAEAARYPKGS